MNKKPLRLCFLLFFFSLPSLFFAQDKVTVVAEKANIYAEPHERAHLIEAVKKGTVLTLFQKGKIRDTWYYVRFYSQRYRGPTTGFIRVEQVEPWSETTPPEIKPPVEPKAKEQSLTKKPDLKTTIKPPPPPEPEIKKEPEVRVEESQVTTLLPLPKALPQEKTELRERTWLSTDLEYIYTTLPIPLALSLPTQHPVPQDLPWRTSETERTLTQLPAGQILERLDAQDALKTEIYAKPKPPPPPPEKPAPPLKPAKVSYSENLQLTRSSNTFEFSLSFGPYSNFRHFEITEPNRIVVDFFDVSKSAGFQQHQINDMGIESIRVAMFEETTARVVFDFLEEIPAYQIEQTEDGLKLLFWTEAAEPIKEPEAKTKELPVETRPPAQTAWTLPVEQTALSEQVWTARKEMSTYTALSPGLALSLPMTQPPLQERFWTVVPPSPPLPQKAKEDIVKKPDVQPEQVIQKPQVSPHVSPPRRTGPITLSLGIGTSMGGAGGFVQYNTKGGLALHAGLGMYPTSFIYSDTDWVNNEMLYSIGLKYYLPFKSQYLRPYLDVQYGGFTIEAVQIIVGIWEYQYIYQNEQKALYGPSALVGGEVKLGTLGLNLAAGVSYAATAWEWKPQDFYFSFDLSLIYNFR